jgi:hypothetical protein
MPDAHYTLHATRMLPLCFMPDTPAAQITLYASSNIYAYCYIITAGAPGCATSSQ